MAVAPASIHRVESVEEVDALPDLDGPVAMLAQTTLSHRDWRGVMDAAHDRWPELWTPGRSDLCFATTNRQAALAEIAPRCDAVVVIGSANSSNTVALEKLAQQAGTPRVLRINSAAELPADLVGVVGVTAGASAPDSLVEEVLAALAPVHGVEEVRITEEDEYFPASPQPARSAQRGRGGGHLQPGRSGGRPPSRERARGPGRRRVVCALTERARTAAGDPGGGLGARGPLWWASTRWFPSTST